MKCYRRRLNISYRDRKTNDYGRQKIEELGGKQERLLQVVSAESFNGMVILNVMKSELPMWAPQQVTTSELILQISNFYVIEDFYNV